MPAADFSVNDTATGESYSLALHGALPIYNTITVTASVTDNAGNQATSSNSPSFTLDTTADAGAALTLSAFNATGGGSSSNLSVSPTRSDSGTPSRPLPPTDGSAHTPTPRPNTADNTPLHPHPSRRPSDLTPATRRRRGRARASRSRSRRRRVRR